MNKQQEQVREFHRVFGHPVADKPTNIPVHRVRERFQMMKEELDEYEAAREAGDMVELADALADFLYTILGTCVEHGLWAPDARLIDPAGPPRFRPETVGLSIDLVVLGRESLENYLIHAAKGELSLAGYDLDYLLWNVAYVAGLDHRIDLESVFEIVHASNMSKLDEAGNPVPHPTIPGKVGKSDLYWEPQEMIANELKVQGW